MMRLSNFALVFLVATSAFSTHADSNTDLFAAIAAQNVDAVALALKTGANTDIKRSIDGHNAKTFAFEQINLAFHTPVPLIASSAAPFALIIASFLHNKNHALAALAGLGTGVGLRAYIQNTPEEEHNLIQKISTTLHLDEIASYASTAGLLASAWSADQLILSSVGTVGLGILYYQGAQLKVACEIYKMVDPEHVLFPELA